LIFVWVLVPAVAVLFVAGVAAAGWFASERLLRVGGQPFVTNLRIVRVADGSVSLPLTVDSARPGTYGLSWSTGYAVVGEIIDRDSRSVTRRLVATTAPLSEGSSVQWSIFVHKGDPSQTLSLEFEDIGVSGELGSLPAWLLPGPRTTWVLAVHGLRATREEALRVLPALTSMGFPVLVVSYRNDDGAPPSPDGYYHLGDTEWRDVEAGVRAAVARGARDIILFGWSMGGCIVETFLSRSVEAHRVRAVILDAPILDWHQSLHGQVRRLHMPGWFTHVLEWFVSHKAGMKLASLNHTQIADHRTVATLVFHGSDDALVPIAASDRFARSRPDLVRYHRVDGAEHTGSWNLNPPAYEDVLRAFLSTTTPPPSIGDDANRAEHDVGGARSADGLLDDEPRAEEHGVEDRGG
jgi:alpha-beta hydrolase superfamily lysophospholipase